MSFKNERLGCDTDYDNSSQEIGNFPRHTNIKIYVKKYNNGKGTVYASRRHL